MKTAKISMFLMLFGMSGVMGCASTHENVAEHHHHEDKAQYEGKCAYSVENGKFNVEGNPDYTLSHNGVTYYFSSAAARDKFNDHIESHVKRANKAWEGRGGR